MSYLRKATEGDGERLSNIAIQSKAFWNYSEDFIESCREELTITKHYIAENDVFVLEGQEEIIGFFTFVQGEKDMLDFFYINPKFIGQGYGSLLWHHVIEKANEIEIESFTIDSDPNAKGFYEKMGAKQIGETPSTVFENRMLPLMRYIV